MVDPIVESSVRTTQSSLIQDTNESWSFSEVINLIVLDYIEKNSESAIKKMCKKMTKKYPDGRKNK